MDTIDPVRDPAGEQKRLGKLYADMADEELEALAADNDTLTEIARQALNDELHRRGIEIHSENSPIPEEEQDFNELPELVTILRFSNMQEAFLARGLLETSGIECFFFNDRDTLIYDANAHPTPDPVFGGFRLGSLGGINLRVKTADADAATEILKSSMFQNPEHEP